MSVLLGKGDGSFDLPVPYEVQAGTLAINHGDFNGDGKLDLIVSDVNGSFEVLPGNGKGGFGAPIETTKYASGAPILIADFNGDGKLDVANGPYVVFGNGKGKFENAEKISGSENESSSDPHFDLSSDNSEFWSATPVGRLQKNLLRTSWWEAIMTSRPVQSSGFLVSANQFSQWELLHGESRIS